ncbi:hypothetical protein D3C84_527350 [compost metagenome]
MGDVAQELILLLLQLFKPIVQPADPLPQQHQFGRAVDRALVRLHAGPQAQDPRLNLTYRVDDQIGKQQHQQQAQHGHEAAGPPDLGPQIGDGGSHAHHVFIDLAAGDHLQLLAELVELIELGAGRIALRLAQVLQVIQPGQRGLEAGIGGHIRDGLLMGGEQLAVVRQLLLVAGEDAIIPQHRVTPQGALQIDGLGREQGRPAGIAHRPLQLVTGQLTQVR